jgi:ketosteroid isomerase-like protein
MPAELRFPGGAARTFERFVAAINGHDIETLSLLMAADHLFVDSIGNRVRGAASMQSGWRGYFGMCPDYRVVIETILAGEDTVLATGEASGTIDGIGWQTPTAWKAIIRDGQVAEWRVFADNKPVYDILARRAGKQHE